jgi:uncharacterized coiled-coil protein SlyX
MSDTTRLDTIEIKIAHLERAIGELSDALVHQQREIERLSARNRQLQDQLETLEVGSGAGSDGSMGGSSDGFEKPPHY